MSIWSGYGESSKYSVPKILWLNVTVATQITTGAGELLAVIIGSTAAGLAFEIRDATATSIPPFIILYDHVAGGERFQSLIGVEFVNGLRFVPTGASADRIGVIYRDTLSASESGTFAEPIGID